MKENNEEQFDQVLKQACAYQADTSRAEFGFETRLMANISQLRSGEFSDASAFLAVFTSWMWRSVAGLTPVVALAVAACVFWFGFSLPADAHSFVNHVTGYLPIKPF